MVTYRLASMDDDGEVSWVVTAIAPIAVAFMDPSARDNIGELAQVAIASSSSAPFTSRGKTSERLVTMGRAPALTSTMTATALQGNSPHIHDLSGLVFILLSYFTIT